MVRQLVSQCIYVIKQFLNSTIYVTLGWISLSSKNVRSLGSSFKEVPNIRRSHKLEEFAAFIFILLFLFFLLGLTLLLLSLSKIGINNFLDLVNCLRFGSWVFKGLKHDKVLHVLNNVSIDVTKFFEGVQPCLNLIWMVILLPNKHSTILLKLLSFEFLLFRSWVKRRLRLKSQRSFFLISCTYLSG